jgi:maltose O-acetyltransferase
VSEKELTRGGLQLGHSVYIGAGTRFDGGFPWLISVGDETVISSDVTILAHDGAPKPHVGKSLIAPVCIGKRVYLGAGAIVLPGVTIGDEAVVGAGSVVRHNVERRTIVAGNPARVVGNVDEFAERHRSALATAPSYPRQGWTLRRGITPERMERMRSDLTGGCGYID